MGKVLLAWIAIGLSGCTGAGQRPSLDLAAVSEPPISPEATEAARKPEPDKLVAVRGASIMVYPAAEEAELRRQRAALIGRFGEQGKDVAGALR